jgi:hypothetical protein
MWIMTGAVVLPTLIFPGFAAAAEPAPPSPVAALRRALEAAGGMDALRRLVVLKLVVEREEITTSGEHHQRRLTYYLQLPGPVPGRLEDAAAQLVAGDDGSGGWAQLAGRPDQRPSTTVMVKRIVSSALFPLLMPFSLTWEGVTIEQVTARKLDGRNTWLLSVRLPRTFFHTPQIATEWKVYLDAESFEVLRAESPHVDLGHGITADGMRFSWPKRIDFHGVSLPAVMTVIGLDEADQEKPHSQINRVTASRVTPAEAAALFTNPSPPPQPQLPVRQRPTGPGKPQA